VQQARAFTHTTNGKIAMLLYLASRAPSKNQGVENKTAGLRLCHPLYHQQI
jgi:hypothetical protein